MFRLQVDRQQYKTKFLALLIMKKSILSLAIIALSSSAFAQNPVMSLSNTFSQYVQTDFREKMYAHTDKDFYVSGDILWYKLYCVNAADNAPVDVSKVAYIELLNAEKQPILQAKIALKTGMGDGSFYIPVNTPSGNYILRTYTNWMKNFPADYYFEKQLTIVNTLTVPEAAKKQSQPVYDAQFFPEGGNLVEGLSSKIAFKVTDQYNKGINFNGALINQNNDTIVRFKPTRYGIGNFNFTPKKGDTYKSVILTYSNQKFLKELPAVYPAGYVMHLDNTQPGRVLIKIAANTSADSVYLFVHSGQQISAAQAAAIKNGVAEFIVKNDVLGDGISHFTIFNQLKQPVCERLYFKAPSHQLKLELQSNDRTYTSRKKVTLTIAAHDEKNAAALANLSLSVYRADSLNNNSSSKNIANYLLLGSELKGDIEDPQYYLSNTEAIDNLMLTHGWRRFKWEDVLANKKPYFKFLPEYEGHIITGRITRDKTPYPNVLTYIAAPGKRVQLYSAKSQADGSLIFITHDLYGNNEIIMHPESGADTTAKIELLSPFSESYSTTKVDDIDYSSIAKNSLLNTSVAMQVRNIYTADSLRKMQVPEVAGSPFYKPSRIYPLDNYTRYNTMSEVFQEITPDITFSGKKNEYSFKVADLDIKGKYAELEGKPLILVDGIPVFNNGKIINYDPLKIQQIETVYKRLYAGRLITDGVINLVTYKGNLSGFAIDPSYTAVDYEGIQLAREFYSPVYTSNLSDHIPDYRTTLFWAPNIHTDEKGQATVSFYTSDLPGEYSALLEGLTPNGRAGTTNIKFNVTVAP
jgi:hypothetical protein